MNVKELIDILSKLDQEKRIVIDGYEGGQGDIKKDSIEEMGLKLNVNTAWYYGEHQQVWPNEECDEMAYCISRS